MKNKLNTSFLPTLFLAGGLLVSGDLMGSYELNSNDVKTITISNEGLTRLSIEGDQIVDVFAYPSEFSSSILVHDSGSAFVAKKGVEGDLYLTLMTQRGSIQDLKIRFDRRNNKPIVFRHKTVKKVSKKQIDRWLTAALLGEAPQGFHREGITKNKLLTKRTTAEESDRYTNDVYDISIFTVSNRSSNSVKISTDLFIEDSEAGRLEKTTLEPNETTLLAVVSKRDLKTIKN